VRLPRGDGLTRGYADLGYVLTPLACAASLLPSSSCPVKSLHDKFKLSNLFSSAATVASPITMLVLLGGILSFSSAWSYGRDRSGQDFYQQPWAVPHALRLVPEENIWDMQARQRMAQELLSEVGGGPKAKVPKGRERQYKAAMLTHPPRRPHLAVAGTPFFFAVLSLFSGESYERDGMNYLATLLAIFFASCIVLGRLMGLGSTGGLLMGMILAAWYEPLRSELRVWNVNCILVGIVTLSLWLIQARRLLLAGIVLALGAAFKPTLAAIPIVLAVSWVVQRRFTSLRKLVLGGVGGGLLAGLGGCLWFGDWNAWRNFLQSLWVRLL